MRYDDLKSRVSGVTVMNRYGEEVNLESVWQSRPVLLAFLRHFG
ncbi:MAG: hypothetical protein R6V46_06540 [Desulfatiglandaceae bacterium]